MNQSTDGVTLFAVFPLGILEIYKDKPDITQSLMKIMEGQDLSDPFKKVNMASYNEMCEWIENNLGKANAKIAGRKVGEAAYASMIDNKIITDRANPLDIMKGLVSVASQMIQDPLKRGWEIVSSDKEKIVMRKTQTFITSLQFGVLEGLLYKCKSINMPHVKLISEVEKGDEFDEFELTWKNRTV